MMKMSERGRPIGFRAVSEGSLSSYVEGGDCFAVSLRSLKMKRWSLICLGTTRNRNLCSSLKFVEWRDDHKNFDIFISGQHRLHDAYMIAYTTNTAYLHVRRLLLLLSILNWRMMDDGRTHHSSGRAWNIVLAISSLIFTLRLFNQFAEILHAVKRWGHTMPRFVSNVLYFDLLCIIS